jgi:RNA polymerase primary sigma factor
MSSRRRHAEAGALAAYLEAIKDTPLLSAEQEGQLADRVAGGDAAARDLMVRANLRLVVHVARSYLHRGLGLEDLVAEGNLGLLRAVEGFDRGVGVRFGTYARHWVKQSIRRALMNQGQLVRLPAYMHTLLSKWCRASRTLADRLGREPSREEVGRALGLSPCRLRMVAAALEADAASRGRDGGGGDEQHEDATASLADARSGSAEEQVAGAELRDRLADRLDWLAERDATILRLRFGLGGDPPLTLQAVGDRVGRTRERVRQREKALLAELRCEFHVATSPAFA